MIATAKPSEQNSHIANGGLPIRLGDDHVTHTGGCVEIDFDVSGMKHKHDYHIMPLPRGIDFIVGMDLMTDLRIVLVPHERKIVLRIAGVVWVAPSKSIRESVRCGERDVFTSSQRIRE